MTRAIRVLLVEQRPAGAPPLREILGDAFHDRFRVVHVPQVGEALACLGQAPFDVILLDRDGPGTSEPETLARLQAAAPHVPILVLTNRDDAAGVPAPHPRAPDVVRIDGLRPELLTRAIEYAVDRRGVGAELLASEARLTGIINSAMDGIISIDEQLNLLLVNPAAEQMFGYAASELVGRPLDLLLPDDVRDQHSTYIEEFGRTGVTRRPMHGGAVTGVRANGDRFPVEASISQATVAGRRIFTAIVRDVTDRQRIEQSLHQSEATNRALFESLADGVFVAQDERFVFANPALPALLGYEPERFVGLRFDDIVAPAFLPLWTSRYRLRVGDGPEPPRHYALQFVRRDGRPIWVELRATRFTWQGRRAVLGIARDVSERHAAEERLRESEARFRQVTESLNEVVWLTTVDRSQVLYISPAYETIWGRPCASLYATPTDWLEAIHPDDRDRVAQSGLARGRSGSHEEEYRIVRPDGGTRWIRDRAFPVLDGSGRTVRVAGVAEDITERRQLEAQLRHTQRMESVGQLAGGVAHDFNNWLTVIFGYTEVLAETVGEHAFGAQALHEIRRAAERAASLTRQLLAFSRKEVLQPAVHDLNVIVRDTEKILQRVLGEDVTTDFALAPGPLFVRVDFSQWVQVLMNLAINARDAMPMGGRLRIETAAIDVTDETARAHPSLRPGPHVQLSMTDNGVGMAPETVARAFEPYFTTKEVGHGTGLGLSVVHGIVEQSRGAIHLESAVGVGTTARMLLPASPPPGDAEGDARARERVHGQETILVVEDEASLRRIAVHGLLAQGYGVIEASNGVEAVEILKARDDIDLVLTDVVMPESGGRQVADAATSLHPGIKVIFMTGYTNDAVVRHGLLDAEITLLQKPFTPGALCQLVRRVLDR